MATSASLSLTLAIERIASVGVEQFRTLNRRLEKAIADAVTQIGAQQIASDALQQASGQSERLELPA